MSGGLLSSCHVQASHCGGFSCRTARTLGHTDFSSCNTQAQQLFLMDSRAGSVVVVSGLSCSTARGIFPDHGRNLCPLHRQVDSYPLCHWVSPSYFLLNLTGKILFCMENMVGLSVPSISDKHTFCPLSLHIPGSNHAPVLLYSSCPEILLSN